MGKRGPKHTFTIYPDELRNSIDNMIKKGIPYEKIAAHINAMDEVKDGELPGTSIAGVHRYAKNFKETLERSKRVREQIKAVLEDAKDNPDIDTDAIKAINKMALDMVAERLCYSPADELKNENILDIMGTMAKLNRSQISAEKLRMQYVKYKTDIENKRGKAFEEFKKRVFEELEAEHPDIYARLIEIAQQTFNQIELEEQK